MNVFAVATPDRPGWRWRIVDHDGEIVEESSSAFGTIAEAVAEGSERLRRRADRDLSVPTRAFPPVSWRRRR
jgi:hypothetical protein